MPGRQPADGEARGTARWGGRPPRSFPAAAVTLIAAITVGSAPADAQSAGPKSLIGLRCQADAARLCAGVEPGGGRLARCLSTQAGDLLPECKGALHQGGWRARGSSGVAIPPAARPVAAPEPARPERPPPAPAGEPEGRAPAPMAPTAERAAARRPGPRPLQALREACGPEVERFCATVEPGRGRVASCLEAHATELSTACRPEVERWLARLASAVAHDPAALPGRRAESVPSRPGVGSPEGAAGAPARAGAPPR